MSNFVQQVPDCHTTYGFYKLFVDNTVLAKMVKMFRKFAARKERPEVQVKVTNNSLRVSHAIKHITGYITLSNRNMYWGQQEDTENNQRERYEECKQRRVEVKKEEEIPLLEFTRPVVEITFKTDTVDNSEDNLSSQEVFRTNSQL